jgi:hypothetical protein
LKESGDLTVAVDVWLVAAFDAAKQSRRWNLRCRIEGDEVTRELSNCPQTPLRTSRVTWTRGYSPSYGEIDLDRTAIFDLVEETCKTVKEPTLALYVKAEIVAHGKVVVHEGEEARMPHEFTSGHGRATSQSEATFSFA